MCFSTPCDRQIMAPKDVHVLIRGTCGKRNLADVIDIQDFEMEMFSLDYPDESNIIA